MDKIDLFSLHSSEDGIKGKIWARIDASQINKLLKILLRGKSRKFLSETIAERLNYGISTVQKHLTRLLCCSNTLDLPLDIIFEISRLSGYDSGLLLKSIIHLHCRNFNSQAVKPISRLKEDFAYIIGAHVSDGYLQLYKGAYSWKVTEGKKELITNLSTRIQNVFGFKANVWYSKRDNMWVCSTGNKIFCRYLEKIVGLPTGKKSHTISEPEIIKKSNLNIRNAFLSGMLNFDGCVKTSGVVSLTSMSGELIRDAEDIFRKNGILVNVTYNKKKKSWIIETSRSRDSSQIRKLLPFFEKDTYKYNRLKFFDNQENYSLDELTRMFPKERLSKISLRDVYNASLSLRKFNTQSLSTHCLVSETTLFKYLYILNKAGLLIKEETYEKTNKNGYISVQYHAVIS